MGGVKDCTSRNYTSLGTISGIENQTFICKLCCSVSATMNVKWELSRHDNDTELYHPSFSNIF